MVEIYVGTGCVIGQFNSNRQQNLKNIYTLTLKAIDFYITLWYNYICKCGFVCCADKTTFILGSNQQTKQENYFDKI